MNLERLIRKNEQTGECLNGKYFWASNMVLLDKINRESILSVVDYMLQTAKFFIAFKQITDDVELQVDEAKE
jgi:hypothetical protein